MMGFATFCIMRATSDRLALKGAYAILKVFPLFPAGMAELADAADSKSAGPCGHGGSTPPPGTNSLQLNLAAKLWVDHFFE